MIQLFVNDYEIETQYLKSFPTSQEKQKLSGSFIASTQDFEIDNTDRTVFDDRYPGSFFYGLNWYGVTVIALEDGLTIWKGRLRNIQTDDKKGTLTLETSNYIQDLADCPCVINSTGDTTPAEIVYTILTDSNYANIPAIDIIYAGFQEAIDIQTANSVFVTATYTIDDGANCLKVIQELCRMCHCTIYTSDNKIYLHQWQAYAGKTGEVIRESNVIGESFKSYFDTDNIVNFCSVAYNNSGTVARATDSDSASISKFGKRVFLVPDDEETDTSPTAYKILFKSVTAANWCVDTAISRHKDMKKLCTITIGDELKHVKMNNQCDLLIDTYQREPTRLIERKYDREKEQIEIKCEYLNYPQQYYERDTTPPEPVGILMCQGMPGGKILLKWSQSQESDHLGYLVYFTPSPGNWETEYCRQGISPLQIQTPEVSADGYCYAVLYGFTIGVTYYFKIVSYDNSYNESEDSNITTAVIPPAVNNETQYCTQGTLFNAISLDRDNSKNGTVPDGFTVYDESNYDAGYYGITAIYESHLLYDVNAIRVHGVADTANDIQLQYRTYENGSFGAWSSAIDAVGYTNLSIGGATIQVRFVFYSPNWSDDDYIYISHIEVA